MNDPQSALIMVTHNNFDTLVKAITSIFLHTDPDKYRLILIDNNSSDNTKTLDVSLLQNTEIIRSDKNVYWAGGINIGLDYIKDKKFEYVFFLNDDIEVYYNWLENHIYPLKKYKSLGAIGPLNSSLRDWQCYNSVRKKFNLQHILPRTSNLNDIENINNKIINNNPYFTYIKGMLAFFCVAFRHETILKTGKLDERFIMGGDDDAYCRELEKNNYNIGLLLNTFVIHKAGVSLNKINSDKKKQFDINNKKLLKKLYSYYYK